MKKKHVIYITTLVCCAVIGFICIYMVVSQKRQKPNESNPGGMGDSEMMHGGAEPEEETDTNNVKEPEREQESQQNQGSQTEWEPKQEQKPEQEQEKKEQEEVPKKEENKTPQPNTETGWGPIT